MSGDTAERVLRDALPSLQRLALEEARWNARRKVMGMPTSEVQQSLWKRAQMHAAAKEDK